MLPKPDVQTREKTKKLGISYDWKQFGQGGGIQVTRSNSQLEETEGQNKHDDNILPEVGLLQKKPQIYMKITIAL